MRGALDFETHHWTNPLACCVMVGAKGERDYLYFTDKTLKRGRALQKKVLETLHQLTEQGHADEWWAHNGGKFDHLMLADAALSNGWKLSGGLAGDGRALSLYFTPPGSKVRVHLKDSMAIVPQRLKHKKNPCEGCCACDWGLNREGAFTGDDYQVDPSLWAPERLKEGCIRDTELVLDLLDTVEGMLEPFGAKLETTFSQAALACVRHACPEPLPSHHGKKTSEGNQRYNKISARAYYGGRVEVFRHFYPDLLREWDRNSSYPASMTQPLPWEFLRHAASQKEVNQLLWEGGPYEGVVHARVTVPDDCYLPVLPIKLESDDGMFFPTGTFDGWWPAVELRYAMAVGAAVNVKPTDAILYTRKQPFGDFISHAYRMKSQAQGAQRAFWKLLLNGAYGKFAQKPMRENLVGFAHPGEAQVFMEKTRRKKKAEHRTPEDEEGGCRPIDLGPAPRIIAWTKHEWPKHTHYALASYVTAYSRIALHRALSRGKDICYCDTDSVHASVTSDLSDLEGAALGQWKVELKNYWGEFFAPKLYALRDADTDALHLAAKGFPVDAYSFSKLVRGEVLEVDRIRLLKSQLKSEDKSFKRYEGAEARKKSWKGGSRKRMPFPDGTTRPWTYAELESGEPDKAKSPALQRISGEIEDVLLAEAVKVKSAQRHTR